MTRPFKDLDKSTKVQNQSASHSLIARVGLMPISSSAAPIMVSTILFFLLQTVSAVVELRKHTVQMSAV